MSVEALLITLVIGAIAGWLAGQIVKGGGFGLLWNIVLGILGAFVGGWLFSALGVSLGAGLLGSILTAAIGAVVIILVISLIKRA